MVVRLTRHYTFLFLVLVAFQQSCRTGPVAPTPQRAPEAEKAESYRQELMHRPSRNQPQLTRNAAKIHSFQANPSMPNACRNPLSAHREKNWLRPELLTIRCCWKDHPTHRSTRDGNTEKIGKAKSSALNFPTAAATGYFLPFMTSEKICFSPGISNFALTTGLDRIFSYLSRIGPRPGTNSLDSASL